LTFPTHRLPPWQSPLTHSKQDPRKADPRRYQLIPRLANPPMWRGFMVRSVRCASQFATRPFLRLAPLEVFAQRKLQPILPCVFFRPVAFARSIDHICEPTTPRRQSYADVGPAVEAGKRSSDQDVALTVEREPDAGLSAAARRGLRFSADFEVFSCLRLRGPCGKNRPPVMAFWPILFSLPSRMLP